MTLLPGNTDNNFMSRANGIFTLHNLWACFREINSYRLWQTNIRLPI